MPSRPRSRLLACAIAALVFACASAQAFRPHARGRQPREPISRHRRAMFHGVCGSRPSASVRRRSRQRSGSYRWGGSSPASGFDLQGLVYWATEAGHRAPAQLPCALRPGTARWTIPVAGGDLLFFYELGHVGMHRARAHGARRPPAGVEIVQLQLNYEGRLVGFGASFRAGLAAARKERPGPPPHLPTVKEVAKLLELTRAPTASIKLTVPVSHRSRGAAALSGSARQSNSTGLLLRHAGPGAEQRGLVVALAASEEGRLGRKAASDPSRTSFTQAPRLAELRCRGRRDAGRISSARDR